MRLAAAVLPTLGEAAAFMEVRTLEVASLLPAQKTSTTMATTGCRTEQWKEWLLLAPVCGRLVVQLCVRMLTETPSEEREH